MNTSTVYALVTVSAFFWGANFMLAIPVLEDLSPLWTAALRFVLGAVIMLIIAAWRGEDLTTPARRHGWVYALLGAVGIGAFNVLFFYALQQTSINNAALIMASNPILTTLIAVLLLSERPSMTHLAALPLALFGVCIVISGGDFSRLLSMQIASGDLLMLAANLAWAFYNVLSRRYMPAQTSIVNTALVMSAGAVLLLAVALSSGTLPSLPGIKALSALGIMVIGGTVLAYLFWNMGIARLGAGPTALFLNLVPVFALLIAAVEGVLPTLAQLSGGLLVMVGVLLSMLPRRHRAVSA